MPWKNWRANTSGARLFLQYLHFYRLMYFNWSPDNSHKKLLLWHGATYLTNAMRMVLFLSMRSDFKKNEYEEWGVALWADNLAGKLANLNKRMSLWNNLCISAIRSGCNRQRGGWNQKGEKLISSQLMARKRRQGRTFFGAELLRQRPGLRRVMHHLLVH